MNAIRLIFQDESDKTGHHVAQHQSRSNDSFFCHFRHHRRCLMAALAMVAVHMNESLGQLWCRHQRSRFLNIVCVCLFVCVCVCVLFFESNLSRSQCNACFFRCRPEYYDLYGLEEALCCSIDSFKDSIKSFPELRYMRAKGNVMLCVVNCLFCC